MIKGIHSIFKTFVLSALMVAQVHFSYAQNAAILPPAKTTFVDQNGKPLTSGKVEFYIPGTTTQKTTWQDAAGTIPNTNPVVLDSAGRALILGNGAYRQIVKDRNNNIQWDQVTNSAGAGGSASETTVGDGNAVGTIHPWSGFIAPANYAFAYGQELARTTYAQLLSTITLTQNITCVGGNATLTTISDTTQLNIGAVVEANCVPAASTIISKTANTVTISANATISTTTSAVFFPWGNGNGLTTFNVPDLRGAYLAGRNNMGGVSSVRLSSPYYTDPNALNGAGGAQSKTLLISEMPSHFHNNSLNDPGHSHTITPIRNSNSANSGNTNSVYPGSVNDLVMAMNANSNTTGITLSNVVAGGGIAVSATVAAGGSGYTAGTQLLTVSGGTCTTQPQFNVTVSAGAITAPVLVTAGLCSVTPSNPAATTGGGGTGGTLNITYSANPISLIPPSKTVNYIIKISPDVNLGVATCSNITDAGTACTRNIGTSGATVPLLNAANSWSANQNFSAVAISSGSFTGLTSPTNPTDAATKAYVDSVASGLNILATSTLATAAILPNAPTYANGAAGVGATLTAGSNTTLTVDGTAAPLNTVVLVKNQASAFQNGIYTVTTAGSGAAAWVLTRATYFDQAAEMRAGSYTFVTSGATNLGSAFTLQTAVTTVGTDSLNWALFSQSTGNVVGPASAVADNIASYNSTTGKLIKDSGIPTVALPTSIGQIPGVTSNTPANAGNIGEIISAVIPYASRTAMTCASTASSQLQTISITAGEWDCTGNHGFETNSGALASEYHIEISTTAPPTLVTAPNNGCTQGTHNVYVANQGQVFPQSICRISVSGSTTVYQKSYSTWGTNAGFGNNCSGGQTMYGYLRCTRVH